MNARRFRFPQVLVTMIFGVAVAHFSAAFFPAARLDAANRPNIVVILSDDHGALDAGCYGNKTVRTPNIDRLSREGMRFTRAFTATAMCTPSRSQIYTGLYPHRNGAHQNHSSLRPGVKTLPVYFKEIGYQVVLAGKRHIKPQKQFPFKYIPLRPGPVRSFLKKNDKPFFLVLSTNDPHKPWPAPEEGQGHDPQKIEIPPYLADTAKTRTEMRNYYADVERLDTQIGQYLDMLDQLGLKENTLVMYVGDHGAQFPFSKWTLYDAGIRAPMIVRWPGHVQSGVTSDALIAFVDFLPTFIELAGGLAPESIDGRSFLNVLTGKTDAIHDAIYAAHTNEGIISGSIYPIRAVRTVRYKYIHNLNHQGVFKNVLTQGRKFKATKGKAKRKSKNKNGLGPGDENGLWQSWLTQAKTDETTAQRLRLYQHRAAEELYDLQSDPFELNNLAGDPKHVELKAKLRKQLNEWMQSQGDPLAKQ